MHMKIDTSCRYADMFTKPLPHATFVMMRSLVLGRPNNHSTPYAPEWQPADHWQNKPDIKQRMAPLLKRLVVGVHR